MFRFVLTLVLVTTWFHMCYFIVLMSSLFFYNVENSKNKEKPLEWVGVLNLLTGTVCTPYSHYTLLFFKLATFECSRGITMQLWGFTASFQVKSFSCSWHAVLLNNGVVFSSFLGISYKWLWLVHILPVRCTPTIYFPGRGTRAHRLTLTPA